MDWNHINTLLSVIHQAAAAGPKFAPIAAAATLELNEYFANPPTADQPEEDDE